MVRYRGQKSKTIKFKTLKKQKLQQFWTGLKYLEILKMINRYNEVDRNASKIKDELAKIYNKYEYILDEYKKENEKIL